MRVGFSPCRANCREIASFNDFFRSLFSPWGMFSQPGQNDVTILDVKEFATDKQALDFVATKIAAQAKREGSPLSDVERKMLYFSETGWTLPEMAEVSAEFDRDYDQDDYERKIAALIGKITAHHHANNSDEQENWDAAIARLSEGDHYILVLVNLGRSSGSDFLPTLGPTAVRPPHDFLRLLVTAVTIVGGLLGLIWLGNLLGGTRLAPIAEWVTDRDKRGILIVAAVFGWLFMRFVWPDLKGFLRIALGRK
jgi:hypothetical protein